jgi:hypothetical protein
VIDHRFDLRDALVAPGLVRARTDEIRHKVEKSTFRLWRAPHARTYLASEFRETSP